MSACSVTGCGSDVEARGYCTKHYQRWWRTGSTSSTQERLEIPIRSDSLRRTALTNGLIGNLISLSRALPGKKGL